MASVGTVGQAGEEGGGLKRQVRPAAEEGRAASPAWRAAQQRGDVTRTAGLRDGAGDRDARLL